MPLFAVNKPLGLTSHDVVDLARKKLGERRIGHTGTLDPLATGLLILASGPHTKLIPFLSGEEKEYIAWISFGATTPTLDAEGPIEAVVPANFSQSRLRHALASFLTLKTQVPPAYSAVKVKGMRAYEAARKGKALELAPRPVRYLEVELLAFDAEPKAKKIGRGAKGWRLDERGRPAELPPPLGRFPTAVVRLVVGAGTYVRAFARDLGKALGTEAFLSGLVRTRVGKIDLAAARPPEELEAARIPETAALPFPTVELSHTEVRRVLEGVPLPIPVTGLVGLTDKRGKLVAVAEGDGFKLRIRRVFK